jgi:hypothetical protein
VTTAQPASPPITRSFSGWLVTLVLAVSVLVVHARVVLGGKTWDDVPYHTEIAPPRLAAADAVLSGQLPGWWEGSGLGVPLVGEPSHGAAYPPVWVATSPHALDLVWIAHLFWLALGVSLLARRLGGSELACVVSGVMIAASGIAASAAVRGALPGLAHLPWVAWAALGLARARSGDERLRDGAADGATNDGHGGDVTGGASLGARVTAAIVLALALGAIGLSGQLALLVDAVAIALVLGGSRAAVRPLALAVGAGLAIACVQWLPALLAGPHAGASVGALKLSRVIELVAPGSFGGSSRNHAVAAIAGEHAGWPSLFVGAGAFALALLSRVSRRIVGCAVALVALAVVAGRGGWPGVLGAPELHLGVLAVLVASLAAPGLDVVLAGARRGRTALVGAAIATALAVGAIAVLRSRADDGSPALDRAVIDGVLAVACLAAAAVVAWRQGAATRERDDARAATSASFVRGSRIAIAALLVAPSVGALGSTAPLVGRDGVEATSMWVSSAATVDTGGAPRRVFRPISLFDDDRSRTVVADAIATLLGTAASRHGLGSARSEDPARPVAHASLVTAAASAGGAFLARYAIALAILPASMIDSAHDAVLAQRGNWALVKYPTSPAAAIVSEWIWVENDTEAIVRLFPAGVRGLPTGLVVLHGQGIDRQDEPAEPQPCLVTRWLPGAIDLTCVASTESQAVISSTSAPGWTVHVAGHDTPWVTADVIRRAVRLPEGAHVVSWRFVPPGFFAGVVIAAIALLALAGYAIAAALRRRRRRLDRESRETN